MERAAVATAKKPVWVDLSSSDAEKSREFYSKLFGWSVEVNPDPQYGGYGLAKLDGKDVAGIGPQMTPDAPTAWSIYIGSDDAQKLAQDVKSAGGTVVMEPFDVGDQGRMAVFQDPTGAFISTWETTRMPGFQTEGPNTYEWAELNARGVEKALPFYERVFGWTARKSEMPADAGPYTEFQLDGQSVAGALEMSPGLPAEVPSYWMIYFGVEDVDAAYRKAIDLGAQEMVAPQEFPGGRFAIVSDPQGAMFGLLKMSQQQ